MSDRNHFINHCWIGGEGKPFVSRDPATEDILWEGRAATAAEVGQAVQAARRAFPRWARTDLSRRVQVLERFRDRILDRKKDLALTISMETGKPLWESAAEVDSMVSKVGVSVEAYAERRRPEVREREGERAAVRFKPHGVITVIGPFNMPGHLPNGHMVPALLAGNTVVFKPSRLAPRTAQMTVECWENAGIPPGVLNLIQGDRESGRALVGHPDIDGLFFTGGSATGRALHRAFAGHPERILALEMGGNNPLVVCEISDLDAAVHTAVVSAYITSGQRCTCARRLILPAGKEGDTFLTGMLEAVGRIRVGRFDLSPEPFLGPVISSAAAETLLQVQDSLQRRGGRVLQEMIRVQGSRAFLRPGLMDVTEVDERPDEEWFGPLLQVIRVADFDAALREANRTAYGLSAGLLSVNPSLYGRFVDEVRAGVINWNRPTTGAAARLPFGGVGASGNHRPGAFYAADFCSYPVASLEMETPRAPAGFPPGLSG